MLLKPPGRGFQNPAQNSAERESPWDPPGTRSDWKPGAGACFFGQVGFALSRPVLDYGDTTNGRSNGTMMSVGWGIGGPCCAVPLHLHYITSQSLCAS